MKYVLGEANTEIVYRYLEANSCNRKEIPQKLEFLCSALRELMGSGHGKILGAACILEETIAEAFALKLGKSFNEKPPIDLVKYVNNLKETEFKPFLISKAAE